MRPQHGAEYGRFFDASGQPKAGTEGKPDNDSSSLMDAINGAREAAKRILIRAKYESVCGECKRAVSAGEFVAWGKVGGVTHAACWQGEWRGDRKAG